MNTAEDLGKLPHWELDSIFPGLDSEPFHRAISELSTQLDDLDKFMVEYGISAPSKATNIGAAVSAIEGFLDLSNAIRRSINHLEIYIGCIVNTDSSNELAKRRYSELDPYGVRIQARMTQFKSWLGKQGDWLEEVLARSESARAHAIYLKETVAQSCYLMSDAEEALAAELAQTGMNAWSKLHGAIWSQLEIQFERDGKIEKLPMPMIQNMALYDPNPAVRQRAAEAEVAAWATMREPLTAALNGVMGTKLMLAKRRGRKDVLHAALDQARIDHITLDAMLDSVRDALPTFRAFLKAKAKMLGKESLAWWDMEASLGDVARHFTFQEARDFITSQFETFNPRMGEFATHAFECNWIDAEPRPGKQGGAYCTSVPGAGIIRVLCNFDGSLTQVSIIAHELGHAYHTNCQTGKTRQQCVSPMTLNETASLFCETLVTDQAIASASSPEEELALLNTFLGSAATLNIVTCLSLYDFEKEAFGRRDRSELSTDEVCEIVQRHQANLYGDGVDSSHLHPYLWASIPHLFMPDISYYNFPYTFGMLLSLGLYAQYKQRGAEFAADFDSLLANTGEFTPLELTARFGIDLRERSFWQASLGLIEQRVQRYQELCIEQNER